MSKELIDEVKRLETKIYENEIEIAKHVEFLNGHRNGFNIAKGEVIKLFNELPIMDSSVESKIRFINGLAEIVKKIQALEPYTLKKRALNNAWRPKTPSPAPPTFNKMK